MGQEKKTKLHRGQEADCPQAKGEGNGSTAERRPYTTSDHQLKLKLA